VKNLTYAPILLFTYKRLDTLQQTVSALQQNYHAKESELFIFSDAPKKNSEDNIVAKVRTYLKTIEGFKKVHIFESNKNKGLANSIIDGVSSLLQDFTKAIVLEDDLITSKNFICFMNSCLDFYENNQNIFSISAYTFPFKPPTGYHYDTYCITRGSSWGWASWRNRWKTVDWSVSDYDEFLFSKERRKKLSESGSDLVDMLNRQMNGKMDSWAIRWYYQQSKNNQLTVYPVISKIMNNGFDNEATHTTNFNRYKTVIDKNDKCVFNFEPTGNKNGYYQKLIQKKFSILTRIIFGTLMSLLQKLKSKL